MLDIQVCAQNPFSRIFFSNSFAKRFFLSKSAPYLFPNSKSSPLYSRGWGLIGCIERWETWEIQTECNLPGVSAL